MRLVLKKPILQTCVADHIERACIEMAIEFPAFELHPCCAIALCASWFLEKNFTIGSKNGKQMWMTGWKSTTKQGHIRESIAMEKHLRKPL